MPLGNIGLYCPVCGIELEYRNLNTYHMQQFGKLCSKKCYDWAQLSYAGMILGKNIERMPRENAG